MYDVLIVDDSKVMREMIKMHLVDSDEGLVEDRIITASDGTAALKLVENKRFDIVLTDFNMPEMDGEEFIRKLRELNHGKLSQVVLMTSQNLEDIKKRVSNTGVKLFLQKPVTKELVNNFILKVIQIEKVKNIIQEGFSHFSKKELIRKIISELTVNINFEELNVIDFIRTKEEFFRLNISSTLSEKFSMKEHRAELLANYLLENYWEKILGYFSESILFEIGNGNSEAENFIGHFSGGVKVVDGKKYIIPSLTTNDGRDVKIKQLHLTAEQYYKQISKIKKVSSKIAEIRAKLQKCEDSEQSKSLDIDLEKERKALENLKSSYKEYQPRYTLILDSIKNAISKEIEAQ